MRSKEGAAFQAVLGGGEWEGMSRAAPIRVDGRGNGGTTIPRRMGSAGPEISAMRDGALPFSEFQRPTSEAESHAMLDAMRA